MLNHKVNNKNIKKNVFTLQHVKQAQSKNQINTITALKGLSNTSQLTNNDVQKVFLLKVLNGNQQSKYIQLPSTNLAKHVIQQPIIDIKLEHFKAPTHVLDHSYAINKGPGGDPLVFGKHTQNNNIRIVENCNLETNTKSASVQSDKMNDPNNSKAVIAELRKQLSEKMIENQTLQKNLKRLQKETKFIAKKRIQEILKNTFSAAQIDKLLSPHKVKVKWTIEDIISALTLQNVSLKAYCYLRDNNYPLPGLSTVRKWTSQINLTEGLMKDVLTIMKFRSKALSIFQKIVILNFDDLSISNQNCLFCIASGLFYKWMQPIYFSYNTVLSVNIIKEIISKLYEVGYIVVAITSNLKIKSIWNELDIGVDTTKNCYFKHPCNEKYKVFTFPDEYELYTLIREQFLEYGFTVSDKSVNKQCIEEIIAINKKMVTGLHCKMINEILDDSKPDKTKTLLTKKLFSKSVAKKIFTYAKDGLLTYSDWKETFYFFDTMSKWIVLFSSKTKEGYGGDDKPYGLDLEIQNDILENTVKLMTSTKVECPNASVPFQEQVILRCKSLRELLVYLKESFSIEDFPIKYIMTNRLGSELLKNIVAYLTGLDNANNKSQDLSEMSQAKFKAKLRKSILGKCLNDVSSSQIWKILDPCLIDFHEKSESISSYNNMS